MKIFLFALGSIVVASISSCGNPPGYNNNNSDQNVVALPFNQQEKVVNNSASQSVFQSDANVNFAAALPAGALNPAHGLAGHRCDLAVGAPLTGPTQQNQAVNSIPAQQQKAAAIVPSVVPATSAKSSAGLNPAHGQKGHRCDIQVGAPLNSPAPTAAAEKQPVQNTQPAVQTPTAMFPSILPDAPATGTARLNPAHGQPGHDCAVAVGEPLK